MSRCKACNKRLESVEMYVNSFDVEDYSMCNRCISASKDIYVYTRDKQFQLEDLEEGITLPISLSDS